MSRSSTLAILIMAALVSGCGSTPQSDHYILTAFSGEAPGNSGPSIGVGPVTVPEFLNRQAMVINQDDHKLRIAKYDRWAEPLIDGVRRVMAVNLASLLDTQKVQTFPWLRSDPPRFGLEINIIEFSAQDSSTRLIAKWILRNISENQIIEQRFSNLDVQAADSSPASIAEAYSELLAQLSREIASEFPREK